MADPPTPPHTPASSSKGASNVNQGNVNNDGIRNNGGVVTGNIVGFNTIVGTLNITVDSASNLTDNIQSFTARVATAAERLRVVGDRIRATSQLLGSIRDLVIARAAREDINIDRDFRVQHGDEIGAATGIPMNDGTRGGNAGGEGARGGIDAGQAPAGGATAPEPNILEKSCFRDLVNASKSASDRFDIINTRIREAFNRIEPVHRGRAKVELSEEDRQRFFLTERDIDDMERHIESHKLEVHIALTAFEAIMADNRSEEIQSIILDMFKEIKRIGEYFLNRSHGPLPPHPIGRRRGTRGLNEQDYDRDDQGVFYRDPYFAPYDRQSTYPYIRPYVFPDLSRLTSLYLGWTFTKGRPPYLQINPQSNQPSWRWAICSQMALSTEELFLKVLAQTTKRSKLRRSIQDDCKDLLRTSVQRMLVDNLLQEQNMNLWRQHPFLELKLAGLSCKRKRVGFFTEETKSIDVILKTEWSPEAPRHDPMGPGPGPGPGGGGMPPAPPPWRGGPGGGGPGGDGGDDGGPFSGPGRPLGTGFHGGAGGGSGPGYPPGRGPRHTSQVPPPPPGDSGFHTGKTSHKTRPQPRVHSPPRTTPSKSAPAVVSREPRMYVVRKKKGKAAASDSESPRRVFIRDKQGFLKVSTENRRPTSSHAHGIDGVPVSVQPVFHSSHPPPPKPAVYSHAQAAYYIPADNHPQTRVYPPPQPAPETVYSSSSSASSTTSSDEESGKYRNWPRRPQPPRHYPPPSMQILSRSMTREQEKKLVDKIFAEWEDGVHGKPTTTRPSATANQTRKHRLEQEVRTKLNAPSALVPQIGPTRRMMMEVEHEAQRHESIEATIRESHRLEEPTHHMYTREPRWTRQRERSFEREREHSFTRPPRRTKGTIFLDRDGNARLDDEGYEDVRGRFADPGGYYRPSAGPSVMVPGPSRWYGPPGPEIRARESHYAHPDVADVEPPFGREFFDTPVVEHVFERSYPENSERRREYLGTPFAEHVDARRAYLDRERAREYFDTPVVEHLDMRRAHPETHGRVRVVPPHMEGERRRVFVAEGPEPERVSRERERINIERRRPRVELYESVYEDESD